MIRTAMFAAVAAVALSGQAFAADVAGVWQTPTAGGQVEISHCGDHLCGKLLTSNNIKANPELKDVRNKDEAQRGRLLKGLPMLSGFKGGPTKWTDGKVYNPDDGGTYSGTIEMLSTDTLKLKGCIVVPLCTTQEWTRVK